jgi:hypothetical protein
MFFYLSKIQLDSSSWPARTLTEPIELQRPHAGGSRIEKTRSKKYKFEHCRHISTENNTYLLSTRNPNFFKIELEAFHEDCLPLTYTCLCVTVLVWTSFSYAEHRRVLSVWRLTGDEPQLRQFELAAFFTYWLIFYDWLVESSSDFTPYSWVLGWVSVLVFQTVCVFFIVIF